MAVKALRGRPRLRSRFEKGGQATDGGGGRVVGLAGGKSSCIGGEWLDNGLVVGDKGSGDGSGGFDTVGRLWLVSVVAPESMG